jgi:membrane protease YdiL (CAAX protease family)
VAIFYAIAFSIATVIAVAVSGQGSLLGNGVAQILVALIYMPAPLVAGLVVERLDGRGFMITQAFRGFRERIGRLLKVGVAFWAALLVLSFGATFVLGNVLGVPGIGALPTNESMFLTGVQGVLPEGTTLTAEQLAQVPLWWLVYVQVIMGGLVAGFTINALFAFGEEYGWRGVLQDELAPLGPVRANILIGLLWGFWHAPLIVLTGYNYPERPVWGTIMMMVALVPFAFIAHQARRITGSLWGPAIVHGVFNASAGIFLFAVGRDALVGAPLGVLGVAILSIMAIAAWSLRIEPRAVPGSKVDAPTP